MHDSALPMGTKIPTPPFSTPTLEDLAAHAAARTEGAQAEAPIAPKRGARRVPVRRKRRDTNLLPALAALLAGVIALALLVRRSR